ncbi:Hsp70 family protein, partial [uncultured Actinomyces sp.]|uniref:Hsp70 family protein n=1 Tax=uncultured Actinomyces sp. TaxID=249061 RepID=UPI0028DB5F64
KRREDAETRNSAEQQAYSVEKLLKDNKDKIPADLSSEVSGAVEQLKKALEGEDIEAIKSAQEKLSTTAQKIGEAIYASDQAAQASGSQQAGKPAEEDNIVDAEIVDDEDSK